MSFHLYLFLLSTFNVLYGLFSLYLKERLFVSEALVSTAMGVLLGPIGLGFICIEIPRDLNLMYQFAGIVLAVQVMASGIQLPSAYLRRHWTSLSLLLGPVMFGSWMITAILVYLFFWRSISWV